MADKERGYDAPSCILLVEDDTAQCRTLAEILRLEGFSVVHCSHAATMLKNLRQNRYDAVVVDLRLPDMDEQKLLRALGPYFKKTPTIVYTGFHSYETAKIALNLGAFAYLEKGGDTNELVLRVHRAVETRLRRYTQALEQDLGNIFNLSLDLICIADIQRATFTRINPAFERVLGFSEAELLGRPFFDFIHPDDVDRTRAVIDENLKQGTMVIDFENRYRCRDGSYRCLSWTSHPRPDLGLTYAIARDVTERRQVEESQRLRDRAINASTQGISISDPNQPDNPTIYVNQGFEKLTGYPAKEILGRNMRFLQGSDTDPSAVGEMGRMIQAQREYRGEVLNYRRDGAPFWNRLTITPVFDHLGRLMHFISVHADVTLRKEAEKALRLERDMVQKYLDIASVMFIALDTEGKVTLINQKGSEILGYEQDKILGMSWFDTFVPLQIRDQVKTDFHRLLRGDIDPVEYYENPVVRKDGDERIIAWHNTILKDEENSITGTLSSGEDITERKRAEETLLESEEMLRTIIEHSNEVFYIHDTEHQLTYVSPHCQRSFGYTPEQMKVNWTTLVTDNPLNHKGFELTEKAIRTGERQCPYLLEIKRKDGQLRFIEVDESPVKDAEGRVIAMSGAVRDITERKRVEQEIQDNQLRLKQLASDMTVAEERLKRTVATELHDRISQSLAMSKVSLSSLRESVDDPLLRERLAEITDTIKDALNESRSLTSQLSYPTLHVLGLTKAVEQWLKEEITAKQGLYTELFDDGLDKPLDEDVKAVLFRSIREALNNVVKHAQAQHVTVTMKRDDQGVLVLVEDDGRGFDPQLVMAKSNGFGLLSILESLERLGGRLELESREGFGCKVTLRVPHMVVEQAEA